MNLSKSQGWRLLYGAVLTSCYNTFFLLSCLLLPAYLLALLLHLLPSLLPGRLLTSLPDLLPDLLFALLFAIMLSRLPALFPSQQVYYIACDSAIGLDPILLFCRPAL